jgi:VanZ family protein
MKRLFWLWGPAVVQMALIFLISAIPDLQSVPGNISDHTGHFLGYGLLGALVLRAVAGGRWEGVTPRAAALAWTIGILYGVTDEWHQGYVSGRTPAVDDLMADALGAAAAIVGLAAIAVVRRRWSRAV